MSSVTSEKSSFCLIKLTASRFYKDYEILGMKGGVNETIKSLCKSKDACDIKLVLLHTCQCITCVYITLEMYRFTTHQPSDVHISTYVHERGSCTYVCNIHIITQVCFGYYPFSYIAMYVCT